MLAQILFGRRRSSPDSICPHRRSTIPLLAVACALIITAPLVARADDEGVLLSIEIEDKKTQFKLVEIGKDASVHSVMQAVAKANDSFKFKSRGRGDTVFVTEINGHKNEGGRGRNWIFHVNEKLGDESAGSYTVKAGDKIVWKFQKYRP